MSKQKKQEPKDQFKEIYEFHRASLYESLSEENPRFKKVVVQANKILEDVKDKLNRLIEKQAQEREIQEMKDYQTLWKTIKQKADNKWLAFQKEQKSKIDELDQQIKLHQTITQAEKKQTNNNQKMKKNSQVGSSKKSKLQVKNQEKQQLEINIIENLDQQIEEVNEQETKEGTLKEIEQNQKEENKEKADDNINDISQDLMDINTTVNTPFLKINKSTDWKIIENQKDRINVKMFKTQNEARKKIEKIKEDEDESDIEKSLFSLCLQSLNDLGNNLP